MNWAAYWFAWFFGGFLVPEVYLWVTDVHQTLSVQTWDFIGVYTWNPLHIAFMVFTAIFFVWVWVHLNFAVLPGPNYVHP